MPAFSPSLPNSPRTVGWLSVRCWCQCESNMPGASGAWKAGLMPWKNPGGVKKNAWVPSWIPSSWRGMVPSWAAGKMLTLSLPAVRFSSAALSNFDDTWLESLIVTKPILIS